VKAASQDIAACMSSPLEVRAQMAAEDGEEEDGDD
jgi:hypothetical protein